MMSSCTLAFYFIFIFNHFNSVSLYHCILTKLSYEYDTKKSQRDYVRLWLTSHQSPLTTDGSMISSTKICSIVPKSSKSFQVVPSRS